MSPIHTFFAAVMIVCGFAFCAGPRMPGIMLVAAGAAFYRMGQPDASPVAWFWPGILFASVAGEVVSRAVRKKLYRNLPVSVSFAANATAGGLSGAFVSSVVFGPVPGLILWQLLAGKTLLPRWDEIYLALKASFFAASLRYLAAAALLAAMMF